MISGIKIQMLLNLLQSGKITIDNIKDPEYRAEVQEMLDNEDWD